MQEAVCVTTLVVDPLYTGLISKISVSFEVSEFRLPVLEIGSLGATQHILPSVDMPWAHYRTLCLSLTL